MNQPTQTQGSAAVPANGVPVGQPVTPAPAETPPAVLPAAEQAAVVQQNPGITLDEVDAIIAQRKAKRAQEQQVQERAPVIPPEFEAKLKTAESQLDAYKRAMQEIEADPLRSFRTLGWKEENIKRMLGNMQVEGQPVHHAIKRVDELEAQLAAIQEEKQKERAEQEQQKKQQMTQEQIQFAKGELSKLHQLAEQTFGKDNLANQYWGDRPREAWDAATEFAAAWCERNQKDTCPYPEVVRYLEQRARRDAAPLVERFAPALGWARAENAQAATSPASTDATPAAAPGASKKTPKVDRSKLSREEQIARADAELKKVREARGQKG